MMPRETNSHGTIFGGIIDLAMWAGYELVAFITDPITWIQETWAGLPDIFWNVFESVKNLVRDAVDMIVHMREVTGKRLTPEQFRTVRTVQDIVAIVDHVRG